MASEHVLVGIESTDLTKENLPIIAQVSSTSNESGDHF